MSRILIVILIYHRHKPIDIIYWIGVLQMMVISVYRRHKPIDLLYFDFGLLGDI
jgi:hypothetical protein